ncbi:MAG TPA: CAP domain-containing protein [Acidimicrobiales bacterium]|nr:CAP domain-containing protein [Acidimicrobiales bacterium]
MSFDARSPVRRLVAVLAVLGVALLGLIVGSPASPGSASTADESTLASLVNGARNAAGLPPLAVSAELSSTARSHSAAMAAAGSLSHSGSLSSVVGGAVSGWTSVAENVAVAGSVTEAHRMLMASGEHRGNILGDFTLLGVGVVTGDDGRVWVTEHFAKTAFSVEVAVEPVAEPVVEAAAAIAPAPAPEPVETVSAAAVEPAPAPVPRPRPQPRARPTGAAATAQSSAVGHVVSCLPPQAEGRGVGHAHGRCEEGPASDGQRGPGR